MRQKGRKRETKNEREAERDIPENETEKRRVKGKG